MLKVNTKKLKPYGDRLDDGQIQMSFTFPVSASLEAKEAAKRYVEQLGLRDVSICAMEPMGKNFTYFVAYGRCQHSIDLTRIVVPKVEVPCMKYEELTEYMSRNIGKQLVVIGACTGSDAHTVGIDAIMNMKGYAHDYGLERYPLFKAYNLRSQLSNADLVEKAVELSADAILVSQVVTQRDSHINNLKELHDLIKGDKRLKKELVVIIGGPRLDHAQALKLGFDAGFGPGTRPSQVASFIVHEYMKRHGIIEKHIDKAVAEKPKASPSHAAVQAQPQAPAHPHAHSHPQSHAAQPAGQGKKRRGRRRGRRGGARRSHHPKAAMAQ